MLLGAFTLVLLGFPAPPLLAESPWRLLKRAESLRGKGRRERENGREEKALGQLNRAMDLLVRLKREHPGWRGDFVSRKIDACVKEISSIWEGEGRKNLEIARSFERLGNLPAAAEEYRAALRANPELREARERLRSLRRTGEEDVGRRRVGSQYGRGIASMEESAALERKGDFSEARERLKDAIEAFKAAIWADENVAESYYGLGTASLRLGCTQEAVYYWDRAVKAAGEDTTLGKQALYKLRLMGRDPDRSNSDR